MFSYTRALVGAYMPEVVKFREESATSVALSFGATRVRVERRTGGEWLMLEPRRQRASGAKVRRLIGSLRRLTALKEFEQPPDALRAVLKPELELEVGFEQGPPTKVSFSSADSAQFSVVACSVSGKPAVYLLPRHATVEFRKGADDLAEPRAAEVDPDELEELRVVVDGRCIEFRRGPDGAWTSLEVAGPCGPIVDSVLAKLSSIEAQGAVDEAAEEPYRRSLDVPEIDLFIRRGQGEPERLAFSGRSILPAAREAYFRTHEAMPVYLVDPGGYEELLGSLKDIPQPELPGQGNGNGNGGGAGGKLVVAPPKAASKSAAALAAAAKKKKPAEQTLIDPDEVDGVKVDYSIDIDQILEQVSYSRDTIAQFVNSLKAGRNVILFGAPGVGKTRFLTIILEQLCGQFLDDDGKYKPNYTIVTANPEWGGFDVIGGVSPYLDKETKQVAYKFKQGVITEGAVRCARSLLELNRPHYVVVDEFNRANIDECFGRLLTVFEYRRQQPLLSAEETGDFAFYLPKQFRLIGTMNVADKNTLFGLGQALMRRFSFIEVGLPDTQDEYKRLSWFLALKMQRAGTLSDAEVEDLRKQARAIDGQVEEDGPFKGWPRPWPFPIDPDGSGMAEYKKLFRFLLRESMPLEGERVSKGVRTFKPIGPAILLDIMASALAGGQNGYSRELATQDAIIANVLPQLEGIDKF
ncbi:MAG TPA: AAA family ATPase, partial [Planctomycetota bacterium]|nr:AAA family ATPase [Planctomycetota bacterium]